MEREVGGGIGMGNTCKHMAVSFQCMTKFTTNKKKHNCFIFFQTMILKKLINRSLSSVELGDQKEMLCHPLLFDNSKAQ